MDGGIIDQDHEITSAVWQACLARCGRLLAVGGTAGLLLVGTTESSAATHRLKILRISSSV